MIPDAELAALAAVLVGAMDQTCAIARPTTTAGTWGEPVAGFTTVGTAVPCLLRDVTTSDLQRYGERIAGHVAWHILLPDATDVQESDRLTLSTGEVLRVQGVEQPQSYTPVVDVIATAVR